RIPSFVLTSIRRTTATGPRFSCGRVMAAPIRNGVLRADSRRSIHRRHLRVMAAFPSSARPGSSRPHPSKPNPFASPQCTWGVMNLVHFYTKDWFLDGDWGVYPYVTGDAWQWRDQAIAAGMGRDH